jgi:serine/threonine protein kinase/Tfp pilus assembly protein PilF
MPEATPSHAADRNLLFGILALQMDFLDRDALLQALHAWRQDQAKPLAAVLLAQGTLRPDRAALLEAMVQAHLEAHGGEPVDSLAALRIFDTLQQDLEPPGARPAETPPDPVCVGRGQDSHVTPDPAEDTPAAPPVAAAAVRFRILRPHAKGGLGQVSVALDSELRREVALKEIQERYADDPASRARFVREAEITGGLEHPGIVPVYGLGADGAGRPYYAMRLIRGESLQQAIARFHPEDGSGGDGGERALALRQLLGRFVAVCQAVAYAHSRGVLHRDLKPGNVMLGPYGETLVVDWGLAKPMGLSAEGEGEPGTGQEGLPLATLAEVPAPTRPGQVVGTPAYMSPEQAAGQLDRLGPAADVYSLGATLYHLLTGRPPFEGRDGLHILRQVQRGEFAPPRQVNRTVAAALEAVCLKAMALRPEDRYAGALALADDVEHWLADEPVTSYREPYRVRAARWLRRHQAVAVGAVVLLLTATAGLALGLGFVNAEKDRTEAARQGEATQRQVAELERSRALDKAAESEAVLAFFREQVLAAARPEGDEGGLGVHATVRDAVRAAEPKIAGAFADRPLVEAAIRAALGSTYFALKEGQAAIAQHERALTLYRDHLGPDDRVALGSMTNLASAYQAVGDLGKALPLFEQAVARSREKLGPDDPSTLASMNTLAMAYQAAGQLDKALPLYEEALVMQKETLGPNHPHTLQSMGSLATGYYFAGQLDKALPLFEEALAKFEETLGPNHPQTLVSISNLAMAYQAAGRLEKALPLLEQMLAKFKEKFGPDHPNTLTTLNNLALAYYDTGQFGTALPLFEQALAMRREKLGPNHPDTLRSLRDLGKAYQKNGDFAKAESVLRECLTHLQKEQPNAWTTFHTQLHLGVSLLAQKKHGAAEPLLLAAYEGLKERQDTIPVQWKGLLAEASERLVQLYDAWGKPEQAARWRAERDKLPKPPEPPKAKSGP